MKDYKYYKSENGGSLFRIRRYHTPEIYTGCRWVVQFSYPPSYIKSLPQLTEEDLLLELL